MQKHVRRSPQVNARQAPLRHNSLESRDIRCAMVLCQHNFIDCTAHRMCHPVNWIFILSRHCVLRHMVNSLLMCVQFSFTFSASIWQNCTIHIAHTHTHTRTRPSSILETRAHTQIRHIISFVSKWCLDINPIFGCILLRTMWTKNGNDRHISCGIYIQPIETQCPVQSLVVGVFTSLFILRCFMFHSFFGDVRTTECVCVCVSYSNRHCAT